MTFQQARIHAPNITGRGGWINTHGTTLSLSDLRGRVVVLDFWTSACINCIHVMEELRTLEALYNSEQVAVIGIHSPKFEHEGDHSAVVAAVERHGIEHPVLDDPEMNTWSAYGVRAWPTLVVIDQDGYVAYIAAGENQLSALIKVIDGLLQSKGQERENQTRNYEADEEVGPPVKIWYPSKLTRLMDGTLLLANTGHHNLLQLSSSGKEVIRAIGRGIRGSEDGSLDRARFSEPTAVLSIGAELPYKVPYEIVVADRGNQSLRTISLHDGTVGTLATGLVSPWDIAYWPAIDRLVVAIAGSHLIASINLLSGETSIIAGSGQEGIRDGRASEAEFAQPSGLAAEGGPDGSLWVIDAETSALRRLWKEDGYIFVETAIGHGLFDFGHKDGSANQAMLQHPQGAALDNCGNVIIADTFNGAIRRYAQSTKQVSTIIDGLQEPTDVLSAGADLVVVESAANRIIKVHSDAKINPVHKESLAPVKGAPIVVASSLGIEIILGLPEPMHIDESIDNPVRIKISSTPASLLSAGIGRGYGLEQQLRLNESVGAGSIQVSATVASCDDVAGLCTLMTQDWNLHVQVNSGGTEKIKLILSGPPS